MSDDASEKPAGLQAVADRHGVSLDGVRHLVRALEAGHGNMAQFDHPDLGGFGQWSRGGMVMIGRMNDHGLKARVDALCTELVAALPSPEAQGAPGVGNWWPQGLGQPSSLGAQNATRYAYFPGSRRLAVETDGRIVLYDTGGRDVTGVSQQQGDAASFVFSGSAGRFSLDDLVRVEPERAEPASPKPERPNLPDAPKRAADEPAPARPPATAEPATGPADILTLLERLAELHRKGVLTEAEFSAKKTELLARL